jgi:hypothetical protein
MKNLFKDTVLLFAGQTKAHFGPCVLMQFNAVLWFWFFKAKTRPI